MSCQASVIVGFTKRFIRELFAISCCLVAFCGCVGEEGPPQTRCDGSMVQIFLTDWGSWADYQECKGDQTCENGECVSYTHVECEPDSLWCFGN